MTFNCKHCNRPIGCVGATYNGEFMHHTCVEEVKKLEKDSEELVSEE